MSERKRLIRRPPSAQTTAVNGDPASGLLHTRFLDQLERHRDDPAIITEDRVLTYSELTARARGEMAFGQGAQPNQPSR